MWSVEISFARKFLTRGTSCWLFRMNQKMACGEFAFVEMSSPLRCLVGSPDAVLTEQLKR